MINQVSLEVLNGDPNLDLSSNVYQNFYEDFKTEFNLSCSYMSELTSIEELKRSSPEDLIIMSINIQSYLSKKSEFLNVLDNYKNQDVAPSFVCFQETWFSEHTNFDLLSIDNYKWHFRSRKNRGGKGCDFNPESFLI